MGIGSTPGDHVAAIDVGGTSIKAALVDRDLRERHTLREPTRRTGGAADDGLIAELVQRLAAHAAEYGGRLRGAGVAVPGIVDDETGIVRDAVNLGWTELPLRDRLAERTGVPLLVRHDVRTGGLAEFTVGAAKGARNALFLPIGTGIAAAVMVDGVTLTAGGYAGEIGHIPVDPGGALCGCGARGCLETVAAAPGIARRYTERTGRPVHDAAEVAARLSLGDPDAREIWDDAVASLAYALTISASLLGPEVIVIGGGLAEAGEVLLAPLRDAVTKCLTFQRKPAIVAAALGQHAGRVGAGLLGWQAADQA